MSDQEPEEQGASRQDAGAGRRFLRGLGRFFKGLAKGLFWILAFVGTLLASVIFHLDSRLAREAIAERVKPLLNESFEGEFSFDVEQIALEHIVVRDFVVRDSEGVVVVSVDEASVDVSRSDLFLGRLVVEQVRVRDPFVDLAANDAGELRIADAFTPIDPAPEDPNATTNIPHIVVEDALLEGGRVENLTPELDLRGIRLSVAGVIDDRIDLTVHDLDAELVRSSDDQVLASVERFEGELGLLEEGAESTLDLRVSALGEDHVEGQVQAVWGESYPDQYDAELSFRASPATLEAAGLPEVAELLVAPVSGRVTAEGSLSEAIDARVELDTAGGPLVASATLSQDFQRIDGRVESEGIALGEVLKPTEGMHFAGVVEAELHPPGDDGKRRIVVDGESIVFGAPDGNEYAVPEVHVAANLGDDHLQILELDLPHLEGEEGHLDLTGRVGFDGAMDLSVDARLPNLGADPNLRQVLDGPVGGGLTVDADVELRPGEGEGDPLYVDASGRVVGRQLRLPWLTAGELDASGSVRGSLPSPRADLRVTAENLNASDVQVDRADLRIDGGGAGGRYQVNGNVDGSLPDMDLDADLDLVATVEDSGAVTVDGRTRVRGPLPEPITVNVNRARIDPQSGVRLAKLEVRSGQMGVDVEGFLDLNGRRSDARIELDEVDLKTIADRFGFGQIGLQGLVSAEIDFAGSVARPVLDTQGRVEDLAISEIQFQQAEWDIELQPDGAGSVLEADLLVESDGNGQAQVDVRAELPSREPLRSIPDANWDATVTTVNLRLGLLPEVLEGVPDLHGHLDSQITLRGTLHDPNLEVLVAVRDLDVPDVDVVGVNVEARVEGTEARVAVDLRHPDRDRIASVVANASGLALDDLLGGQPLSFLTSPWSVELSVPEQSLASLPAPARVDLPLLVEAQGRFSGGEGRASRPDPLQSALRQMTGQLRLLAHYEETDHGCGQAGASATADVIFENGETELRVVGASGDEQNLVLEAFAETPVHRWLDSPPDRIPEVELALEARDLPLRTVPVVCDMATGIADLQIEGVDLFDAEPRVSVEASVADFTLSGSESVDLQLQGALDATRAEVSGQLSEGSRVAMRFEGRAPMRWGGEVVVPELSEDGRWSGEVDFDETPVRLLLAAVPMLAEPHGRLDGEVRAAGVGSEVEVEGQLEMHDVGFILRQPYMRIEDLNGGLALHDRTIHVDGIRFADRDGDVRVDGDIELDGWMPGSARMRIRSDDFPLRVEGVIYAYLDTDTEVDASFGSDVNRIDVEMRDTAVRLPQDIGRSLQPLTQHADVIYENQPGFDPNDEIVVQQDQASGGASAFADTTRIEVRSSPFWVRRDDFAVQVEPRLTIEIEGEQLRMSGPVEIRRGYIAFMGKEFDFKRGEVRFTGGNSVDPLVDIEATHDLGGGSEVITAKITGHLMRPELEFSSSSDPNISDSEAIQLLVRGRPGASSETATQQAASFLTGMFAGVLSSVTRREVGEYIPVFGIESQGGTATLRVGFQADQLIPDALDDVILGAYVEGYVGGGANNDGGGGGAVTGGAVVEFVLPRHLVWSGTYDVPTNWSVDLMWEP